MPAVFSAAPVKLHPGQNSAVLNIKGPSAAMKDPMGLTIIGSAKVGEETIVRQAVPADDQMQAFLWRHLVPASKLAVLAYDPGYEPPPKRLAPAVTSSTNAPGETNAVAAKPKFTKQQIARRLRELQRLYEEDFLTDEFYQAKIAECQTAQ